ncbi:Tubulin-folding cofactor C [Apostasia shenzhenica]|uniref:Tubulin-folding cofactor C n=1 Tax=Apostasia shenzhenica TaxID=1088818 RepID=A0A2I0ACJ3_9ASPA|nr:Tubulin-folding cofactor C [Apostasia shenzhenica]
MEDEEVEKTRASSMEVQDPIAQKKHAAMLERLSNLHQSRLQQSTSRRSATDSSSPAFESVHSFLARFSDAKRSLEAELRRFHALAASSGDAKSQIRPDLEKASAAISDLERQVAENSYFLPPYEVRSSLKTIAELKESVESAYADILPRKKFSFRSKASSNKVPTVVVQGAEEIIVSDDANSKLIARGSPGLRDLQNAVLVKHFSGEVEGDFTLADLHSCEVYLKGRFGALFIHRLRNCRIFAGPVIGSVLIEEVNDCLFMLASHQIRIHQAKDSDFYLRVRTRPIIEDCSRVRFGPYRLCYDGIDEQLKECGLHEETGNWASVDDFRWLRAVQSPNWCVISEHEFVGVTDISGLEEKNEIHGLST